ncbi:KTSC domain-containing protein [soil metagenome]
MLRFVLTIATVLVGSSLAEAETVDVKYRGLIDLKTFSCQNITRSSFINRVCYDQTNQYMIIQLNSVYYHYCELPKSTLDALLVASSMGQYFNGNIKGSGKDGPYDCRTHHVPRY